MLNVPGVLDVLFVLNVLDALFVLNVLDELCVLDVLDALCVLNVPKDASLSCWALFLFCFISRIRRVMELSHAPGSWAGRCWRRSVWTLNR